MTLVRTSDRRSALRRRARMPSPWTAVCSYLLGFRCDDRKRWERLSNLPIAAGAAPPWCTRRHRHRPSGNSTGQSSPPPSRTAAG